MDWEEQAVEYGRGADGIEKEKKKRSHTYHTVRSSMARLLREKASQTGTRVFRFTGCYINEISLLVEQAIQREIKRMREKMREHEWHPTDGYFRAKAMKKVERRILLNKCVATISVLLYAAFSLKKVPSTIYRHADRAAAAARYPSEARRDTCGLLRFLLRE